MKVKELKKLIEDMEDDHEVMTLLGCTHLTRYFYGGTGLGKEFKATVLVLCDDESCDKFMKNSVEEVHNAKV
jgi:hypothetical protein